MGRCVRCVCGEGEGRRREGWRGGERGSGGGVGGWGDTEVVVSLKITQMEVRAFLRPSITLHTTKRHRKHEGGPSSQKAHNVQTATKIERTREANSTQKSSSLTFLLFLLMFSHHIPLLFVTARPR